MWCWNQQSCASARLPAGRPLAATIPAAAGRTVRARRQTLPRRARLPRCAKLLQRRWLAFSVSLFSASSVVRHPILCTPAVRGLERGEKSYSCRAACMRCFGFSLSCFVLCVYVTLGRRRGRDRARAIRSIGLVLVAAMRCVWPRASDIYQHESTLDACQSDISATPSSPFWLIPSRPHRAAMTMIILSEPSFASLRELLTYIITARSCMAN